MDIDGLHEIVKNLREDFKAFKENDFVHLEEKVDKLVVKVALIVGGISTLTIIANILVRIFGG